MQIFSTTQFKIGLVSFLALSAFTFRASFAFCVPYIAIYLSHNGQPCAISSVQDLYLFLQIGGGCCVASLTGPAAAGLWSRVHVSRAFNERVNIQCSLGLNLVLTFAFLHFGDLMLARLIAAGLGFLSEIVKFNIVSMLIGAWPTAPNLQAGSTTRRPF